jgi:hypothetical protein
LSLAATSSGNGAPTAITSPPGATVKPGANFIANVLLKFIVVSRFADQDPSGFFVNLSQANGPAFGSAPAPLDATTRAAARDADNRYERVIWLSSKSPA